MSKISLFLDLEENVYKNWVQHELREVMGEASVAQCHASLLFSLNEYFVGQYDEEHVEEKKEACVVLDLVKGLEVETNLEH
ncbi:hypothetical protein MTR_2g010100 [Medicago truncatula]|uniref:Uncharacterized protein n=1 Tax=Medicago truncatula TaxID=3880 RepID=G7ISA3_MEDTR|nr:hypothetical protein MTR_2g010100 [Medicago truncatula]